MKAAFITEVQYEKVHLIFTDCFVTENFENYLYEESWDQNADTSINRN